MVVVGSTYRWVFTVCSGGRGSAYISVVVVMGYTCRSVMVVAVVCSTYRWGSTYKYVVVVGSTCRWNTMVVVVPLVVPLPAVLPLVVVVWFTFAMVGVNNS